MIYLFRWKRVRDITSPTFTGRKLKLMQPLMNRCIDAFVHYIEDRIENFNGILLHTKKATTGFTTDVIAATLFSTETHANSNSTSTVAIELFHLSPWKVLFVGFVFRRWLNDLLGFRTFFPEKKFDYFGQLATEILNRRKQDNLTCDSDEYEDMLQSLINADVGTDGKLFVLC